MADDELERVIQVYLQEKAGTWIRNTRSEILEQLEVDIQSKFPGVSKDAIAGTFNRLAEKSI